MLAKLIGEEAVNAWRFLDAKQIKIGGQSVHAVRITYTGELGWELHIPEHSCLPVYLALQEVSNKPTNQPTEKPAANHLS